MPKIKARTLPMGKLVSNTDENILTDLTGFRVLQIIAGTVNGQKVWKVSVAYGAASASLAIFSEKDDAVKCYEEIRHALMSDETFQVNIQNKVKESLLVMPGPNDINNVVELKK